MDVSIQEIEKTNVFKNLNNIQQMFVVKRKNREILTNALIVYKSTGVIPGTVHGYNLAIVHEMLFNK